jgi:hypothetical protein
MRLRQLVCAGLVAAPVFGTLAAQGAATPLRRFGFTAGVNSSNLGGADVGDQSRRTGFTAGGLLILPLGPEVAVEPEFLYTTKGAVSNGTEPNGTKTTATLKMNYVEVPVLLRLDLSPSGDTRPFLYAGPAISFKASCTIEGTSQGVSISSTCDALEVQGAKVKTVDYGLIGGGGVAFNVGGRAFSIGARYDHSLGKISSDSDVKHRVISVLATFEFPWGK